jgi:tryptophan synthase
MAASLRAAFSSRKPHAAFVAYLTCGFPDASATVPALLALQAGGADVLELGVPFSDPMADGGTIQCVRRLLSLLPAGAADRCAAPRLRARPTSPLPAAARLPHLRRRASEVALSGGATLAGCLAAVRAARAAGLTVPVVLMGYYNPALAYGEARLVADAAAAGVSGFILVDLPPEECASFLALCDGAGLAYIPLVAPTTADDRLRALAKVARGFVYCVSVTGVTGARAALDDDLAPFVARVRKHIPDVPLAVGFGISTPEHVAAVGKLADGVVMGSAIIAKLEAGGVQALTPFLQTLLAHRG